MTETDIPQPAQPADKGNGQLSKPDRSSPSRRLPTPRIAFNRQLDLLRGYAAKSQNGSRPVASTEITDIVGLTYNTVSLGNAFFTDVGFLTKTGDGFVPSQEVLNFARVHAFKGDDAATELAPLLREAWFGRAILERLVYSPLTENDAIVELAKASNAGAESEGQLDVLLDYLVAAGLIEREGGQIKPSSQTSQSAAPKTPAPKPASETPAAPTRSAGSTLPLLVQGLLQALPSEGKWTREEADAWLALAENIFQVVYKVPPKSAGGHP